MSRDLETRRRAAAADPEDPSAAFLLACLRTGRMEPARVKAAAACRHPAALAVFPGTARRYDLPDLDLLSGREQRLFAADCAERVLSLFKARYPADLDRLVQAIEAARRHARGEASGGELIVAREAASAAAFWAAQDAAPAPREAASAAAWAASEEAADQAAEQAASAAAWAVAEAAAREAGANIAAWSAAWDQERAWQLRRLAAYFLGEVA